MQIKVNGEDLAMELTVGMSLGDALAAADELLETAGAVIIGLKIDGKDLDADEYPSVKDKPIGEVERIDIAADSISAIKAKAVSTFLELVSLSSEAAASGEGKDWAALAGSLGELSDAFAGLFSADELAYVRSFADLASRANASGKPDASLGAEIARQAESLSIIFRERLAEIERPGEEMRKAAALYRSRAAELDELPVLLQTGKDEGAMKAILFFIEIFNKVIRIVPELAQEGLDTGALRIGEESLPEFYNSFNDILRRLSTAFEEKDSVLIGDLAEYEVAPRMASFFAAVEEALATP
jgi:hypothetical protein